MRHLRWYEHWLKDIRYALRGLRRSVAFTAATVLSLALGIGASTAIFSLTDQMLLRLLPVKEPDQLVLFQWKGRFIGGSTRGYQYSFSYPAFRELSQAPLAALSGIAAQMQEMVSVDAQGQREPGGR